MTDNISGFSVGTTDQEDVYILVKGDAGFTQLTMSKCRCEVLIRLLQAAIGENNE